jgi:hypothetical protein
LKKILKLKSKFSEPKSKSVFIESVFYVFVFDFGITSIISKNYDSIYFDTKFNRCHFDKYRIVAVLYCNIEMTSVSVALKKNREYFPFVILKYNRFYHLILKYNQFPIV